jgi:hypothetical protein
MNRASSFSEPGRDPEILHLTESANIFWHHEMCRNFQQIMECKACSDHCLAPATDVTGDIALEARIPECDEMCTSQNA